MPEELDMELTEPDVRMVHEFEDSWKDFIAENPNFIPMGKKRNLLNQLQRDIMTTQLSKQAVEAELQRQLEFFQESRDSLEQHYGERAILANSYQSQMHDHLQDQLDKVSLAKSHAQQTIVWNHFLHCVDKATPVPPVQVKESSRDDKKEKTFKPSPRAMALVDPGGDDDDVSLRAYRLDHALLSVQVKMLGMELERYELTTASLDTVGKFMSELNIWGLLTKQQQEEQVSK